jgi:hypothetical protein
LQVETTKSRHFHHGGSSLSKYDRYPSTQSALLRGKVGRFVISSCNISGSCPAWILFRNNILSQDISMIGTQIWEIPLSQNSAVQNPTIGPFFTDRFIVLCCPSDRIRDSTRLRYSPRGLSKAFHLQGHLARAFERVHLISLLYLFSSLISWTSRWPKRSQGWKVHASEDMTVVNIVNLPQLLSNLRGIQRWYGCLSIWDLDKISEQLRPFLNAHKSDSQTSVHFSARSHHLTITLPWYVYQQFKQKKRIKWKIEGDDSEIEKSVVWLIVRWIFSPRSNILILSEEFSRL